MYKFLRAALVTFLFLTNFCSFAQNISPGKIYRPATTAINPMDPNGDGWISSTNAGFAAGTENIMEVPFVAIPQVNLEPNDDLRSQVGNIAYTVTAMHGQMVAKGHILVDGNAAEISISLPNNLPYGLYVLEVILPQQKLSKRFVLNR